MGRGRAKKKGETSVGFAISDSADGDRWDPPEVPFEIKFNDFASDAKSEIERAINQWNSQALIPLVDREQQKDYVVFVATQGICLSPIGHRGGRQEIRCDLGGDSNFRFGNVMHEIGHAVGLEHEHQRPDQATRIRLIPENIDDLEQYKIIDDDSRVTLGIYDYDSIMHYGPGDPPRFEVIEPGADPGQRKVLSAGDISSTQYLYGFSIQKSLDFGLTAVGDQKLREVKVVNESSAALSIESLGVTPAFFTVSDFPSSVEAFRTAFALVGFAPTGVGSVQATYNVRVAGGLVEIRLFGRASDVIEPRAVLPRSSLDRR